MIECENSLLVSSSRSITVSRESWILGAICFVDMISTILLVHAGKAVEANPLLAFFMDRGIAWFFVAKSVLFLGPLLGLELLRLRRPVFVKQMLRVGIGLYLLSYGVGVSKINSSDSALHIAQIASRSEVPHGNPH